MGFLKKIGKQLKKDIKAAAKGSKEYQAGRARAKQRKIDKLVERRKKQKAKGNLANVSRLQNQINQLSGSKVKHKIMDVKAKAKAEAPWKKAVKKQKETGGPSISSLVAKRKGLKKGTAAYAKVQNAINEAYGSKVRHKAEAPKKITKPKKVAKTPTPSPVKTLTKEEKEQTSIVGGSEVTEEKNYAGGGKVEASNPYGWPSRDARNGGQK